MPYPVTSKAEARSYLLALESSNSAEAAIPFLPPAHTVLGGTHENWEQFGRDIAVTLTGLTAEFTSSDGKPNGAEFEAAAGPEIHKLLPPHPALSNPEFWNWLTLNYGESIVRWRYGDIQNHKNFGVGAATENYLYRLWLRAEMVFKPGAPDPYELARVGDIDFWRSHVFRQRYGEARSFIRAFVEFQFPAGNPRKARLKIAQIREFAKHLKRARSNLTFELMSEARALHFIESEWERLNET